MGGQAFAPAGFSFGQFTATGFLPENVAHFGKHKLGYMQNGCIIPEQPPCRLVVDFDKVSLDDDAGLDDQVGGGQVPTRSQYSSRPVLGQ